MVVSVLRAAEIALPLTRLQSGTEPWTWGDPEEAAFAALKKAIAEMQVYGFDPEDMHEHIEGYLRRYQPRGK